MPGTVIEFVCVCFNDLYLFNLVMLRGMRDLSSPTGDGSGRPLQWKRGVLTTGPPENSLFCGFFFLTSCKLPLSSSGRVLFPPI